jgi:hypothetical protein
MGRRDAMLNKKNLRTAIRFDPTTSRTEKASEVARPESFSGVL